MSPDDRGGSASQSHPARAVPGKPTLDGLEDTWSQRWHEARVVQV